jgi:hypothetical protein
MKKPTKPVSDLPPDVVAADTKYPKLGTRIAYDQLKEMGLGFDSPWTGVLTFYRTQSIGWVLCTLPISGAGRGSTPRTYGIGVADSKVYTVGKGPHVLQVVEVRVTNSNLSRLTKYIDLWKKGMADAGSIRDRISSRRAQGQVHRQNGRTHWQW